MKTALLLSGQLRSFKQCYPSLKHYLLDVVHPDIFLSTWVLDKPLFSTSCSRFIPDEGTVDEAIKLYRPVSLSARAYNKYWREYFTFPEFAFKKLYHFTSIENCMAMFWHWMTVFELFEPYAQEYQCVILSRFDVAHNKPFPAQDVQQQLMPHLPIVIPWGLPDQGEFIDLLCVGNVASMAILTQIFNHVKGYVHQESIPFHPESLLLHHCKKHLHLQRFTFPTWVVRP